MVRVFRDAGYQVSRAFAEGVLHLEFDIDPTERSLAVRDSREQRAEARSVHNALHPSSVAVIGASTDPSKIGHAILANLLRERLHRPGLPGQRRGALRARRAGVRLGHRHPGRRSTSRWSRCPPAGVDDVLGLVLRQERHDARRGERRVRGDGPGGLRPSGAGHGGPRARHARDRPQRARGGQHRRRRCGSTPRSPRTCPDGADRVLRPVRGARHRDPRGGAQARAGAVDLRLGGQPRRPVRQRPAAVLADRPGHRPGAAVPGDVRQPAQVRPGRAAARAHQADRRGEERAAQPPGRGARARTPSRSTTPASRAVRAGGRHPGRHARRAVRHRAAAGPPAAARRAAGRGRGQLHRARRAGRRRVGGGGDAARGRSGRHRRHRLSGGVRRRRRRRRSAAAEGGVDAGAGAADALVAVFVPPDRHPGRRVRAGVARGGRGGRPTSRSSRCSSRPRVCPPSWPFRAKTARPAAVRCPATPAPSAPPPRWPG